MNESFNKLFADIILRWILVATTTILFIALFLTVLFYARIPPFIPIFNQQPWGEAQIGTKTNIFIPISIAVAICIINSTFASFIYSRMPLIARIICVTGLFIAFFLLLFIIRTILVST